MDDPAIPKNDAALPYMNRTSSLLTDKAQKTKALCSDSGMP